MRAGGASGAALLAPKVLRPAPLHLAAAHGHAPIMALLLARGVGADQQGPAHCTPLHLAVGRGHLDAVAVRLAAGATPDARDAGDETPLHWAAAAGEAALLRLLLEREVDPLARHFLGGTPEMSARRRRPPTRPMGQAASAATSLATDRATDRNRPQPTVDRIYDGEGTPAQV